MDVTNPGLVSVADQTSGNPDLRVSSLALPEELAAVKAGSQAAPRVEDDVGSQIVPSAAEEYVGSQPPPEYPQDFGHPIPQLPEIDIAQQCLGQGVWLPLDPTNPSGEKYFAPPSEFIVGENVVDTIQVNRTAETIKEYVVTAVLDAATMLPAPLGAASGVFLFVSNPGPGRSTIVSSAPLPVNVVNGLEMILSGSTVPSYTGRFVISNVTVNTFDIPVPYVSSATGGWFLQPVTARYIVYALPIVDSEFVEFTTVADAGGGYVTVTSADLLSPKLVNGSIVNLHRSTVMAYDGTYVVSGVTPYTFNIQVAFAGTATGYTFIVNAPNLTGYPISMLGREIIFDELDNPLSELNSGATRIIAGYNNNYIAISSADPADWVSKLVLPQVGDTFTVNTRRNGSEVFKEEVASTIEVDPTEPPPVNVPNPPQALSFQGNVNVSTGPQPVLPPLDSGQRVPSAINVNISDQAPAVGLPVNVFI